ncbi:alpha-N-acetylgalactosaminidase-like isoform X2 [Belonocnema kinseyi]|nr:alpha-N-acetylgalactosaminidase-like isoform X2 [Belonocnema kinseyi]
MAAIIAEDGYAELGYEYVNIDDCWSEKERGPNDELLADKERFPDMTALGRYIHSKGLKFGIYADYGKNTCGGYPGLIGHLEDDANLFASWGVDYIKVDGCNAEYKDMDTGYPEFGKYLNKTGRPMVYSCSWPVYQTYNNMTPDWKAITNTCNLWRNWADIQDSWDSVKSIIDHFGDIQDTIVPLAAPGQWNDADMVIVGDFGLSHEQSKVQMAIWAILAQPLLMSNDLRNIRPEYKAILQNKKIIAVDQDPLGIQGRRIKSKSKDDNIEIWVRPITPNFDKYYSYAIAFLNSGTDGTPTDVTVTLKEIGLDYSAGYRCEDLYNNVTYDILKPRMKITVRVNPTGVVMLRCDLKIVKRAK